MARPRTIQPPLDRLTRTASSARTNPPTNATAPASAGTSTAARGANPSRPAASTWLLGGAAVVPTAGLIKRQQEPRIVRATAVASPDPVQRATAALAAKAATGGAQPQGS